MTGAGAPLAVRAELARKALHLLSVVVPVSYARGVPRNAVVATLAAALLTAAMVEWQRRRSRAVQRWMDRTVGPLFRAHEHARLTGATWLALALLLSAALLPRAEAIAAMWAASAGDPAAALAGRTLGRVRFHSGGKSLEGALACAAVTGLGAYLLTGFPPWMCAAAGLAAALFEWPARPLDDNLRIAFGVGATLTLLRMFVS